MKEINNIQYKNIVVTDKNYRKLKGLGSAGDSFNDVITDILEKVNGLQESSGRELQQILVNSTQSNLNEGGRNE